MKEQWRTKTRICNALLVDRPFDIEAYWRTKAPRDAVQDSVEVTRLEVPTDPAAQNEPGTVIVVWGLAERAPMK